MFNCHTSSRSCSMTCEPLFHTIVFVTLNLNIKRRYTCCVILISEIKQFINYHKVHSTCFMCVNNTGADWKKLEKILFFGVKSAQFFLVAPPLTWNPGSAPVTFHIQSNLVICGSRTDRRISEYSSFSGQSKMEVNEFLSSIYPCSR